MTIRRKSRAIDTEFGRLIQAHRYDFRTLAKALGVSAHTANRWAQEKIIPPYARLERLSRLLDEPIPKIVQSIRRDKEKTK